MSCRLLRIAHDFKDKLASISPTQYSQSTFFHIFRLFETQGSKARGKERKTLRNKKRIEKEKKNEVGAQRGRVRYGGGKGEKCSERYLEMIFEHRNTIFEPIYVFHSVRH